MKKILLIPSLFALIFASCSKDDEIFEESNLTTVDPVEETTSENNEIEVEEFIWDGLNEIYLYKADVPELADDYFTSHTEKTEYLTAFRSPEDLFYGLKYSRDRFSFITDDYEELENSFKGISSSTAGMEFGLGRINGSNNIFGYLQYVIPGTSADEAGLTRGTIFTEIDGKKMTLTNFQDLMSGSFTINIGKIEDSTIKLTGETVTLEHGSYTANPIQVVKTLDMEGKKIGYLMYNSFISDFDDELNDSFGQLKSDGVTELVLDLRYNGGGSVETAVDLASMITGQFKGKIFMKEQWNENYQAYYEDNNPELLINRFNGKIGTGEAINSLNLSRVYVLTSGSTASASELIINGLEPYIDVVQIGEHTTGKFQASVTLYDSEDFGRDGASENHKYALQPLVLKSTNAAGKSDYEDGLPPDVEYIESVTNLGTLGEPSEPLLQVALNHLFGKTQITKSAETARADANIRKVGESGMYKPNYQRMYIDRVPEVLGRNVE